MVYYRLFPFALKQLVIKVAPSFDTFNRYSICIFTYWRKFYFCQI